jgi:glucokinase
MILASDIGGTKTNLALFEEASDSTRHGVGAMAASQSFPNRRYPSLEAILSEFRQKFSQKIQYAGIGIAAPINQGVAQMTNLSWKIDSQALSRLLGIGRVALVNDLEATAYGIDLLAPQQFCTLNVGQAVDDNRALIAAGTGLGMAGLYKDARGYVPISSEGGHADFGPQSELEINLLRYLQKKFNGHVSYERIVSGPGLVNIYSFLRDEKIGYEDAWLEQEMAQADKTNWAALISRAGMSGKSRMAQQAVDMFTQIYGATAGNLALMMKSLGGFYVGGGIAPKMLDKLKDGAFMHAFTDKGRYKGLMTNIPVHVILDDKTALYGAARAAVTAGK